MAAMPTANIVIHENLLPQLKTTAENEDWIIDPEITDLVRTMLDDIERSYWIDEELILSSLDEIFEAYLEDTTMTVTVISTQSIVVRRSLIWSQGKPLTHVEALLRTLTENN